VQQVVQSGAYPLLDMGTRGHKGQPAQPAQ
jgi:hypothetical protein